MDSFGSAKLGKELTPFAVAVVDARHMPLDVIWKSGTALLVLLFSLGATGVLSTSGSVLSSYRAISSDGLDWIIQGRALAAGVLEGWPILRNPGFVFVSAADDLAGGRGLAFAVVGAIGLALQASVVIYFLRRAHITWLFVFVATFAFSVGPLHFIATYVLSEHIAIGILAMSAALLVHGIDHQNAYFIAAGAVSSVIASQFQLYGLAPILILPVILAIRILRKEGTKHQLLTGAAYAIGSVVLYVALTSAWRSFIDHGRRPAQLELLEANLNMFEFYVSIWLVLMLPYLLVAFSALPRVVGFLRRGSLALFSSSALMVGSLGFGLAVLALMYQWEESRFAYTYFWAVVICVCWLAFGKSQNSLERFPTPVENSLAVLLVASSVLVCTILVPTDYWKPRLGAVSTGATWWQLNSEGAPPFSWYEESVEALCSDRIAVDESQLQEILAQTSEIASPYQLLVAEFGWRNCLD